MKPAPPVTRIFKGTRPPSYLPSSRADGVRSRSPEMPYATLRPANAYGPRQRSDLEWGVVAVFLQCYSDHREPTVYGDAGAARDYVHVGG